MKCLWMNECLKKRDKRELSSPNDFLNFLRMDGWHIRWTFKFRWPKNSEIRYSYVWRHLSALTPIHNIAYSGKSFSETWREIHKILKYNTKAFGIFKKPSYGSFIYSQSFCQKSAEKKKYFSEEIFFKFHFWWLNCDTNPDFCV